MQVNAIQRTVEQFANVKLLPKAPSQTRHEATISKRVFELGPTIVAMEARGLSQGQIAAKLKMSRTSINQYSVRYRDVLHGARP